MDFIVISFLPIIKKITNGTAYNQCNRDKPKSADQQEQDSLDCAADGEHAFLRDFCQQQHHHDSVGDCYDSRIKYVGNGSGNAHYGADNHANDPHERSQNADQDKIPCIQLLIHGCSS